jgi:hypothetical protein
MQKVNKPTDGVTLEKRLTSRVDFHQATSIPCELLAQFLSIAFAATVTYMP